MLKPEQELPPPVEEGEVYFSIPILCFLDSDRNVVLRGGIGLFRPFIYRDGYLGPKRLRTQ